MTTKRDSRRESPPIFLTILLLTGLLMLTFTLRGGCDGSEAGDVGGERESATQAEEPPVVGVDATPVAAGAVPAPAEVAPGSIAAARSALDPSPAAAAIPAPPGPAARGRAPEPARSQVPAPGATTRRADPLDRLNPAGERVVLEGKYEVPVVSDGRETAPSLLPQSPGYQPLDDPEFEAIARGYRLAPPNPNRLVAGSPSAEDLARDILWALGSDDRQGLFDLRVSFEEFRGILWPEMPQSRPVTNISAEDAWFFLQRESVSAIDGALGEHGGHRLSFTRLTFDIGLTRYPNYRLYRGVVIHANGADGQEIALRFAHTWVEKDGVWKVCMYKG